MPPASVCSPAEEVEDARRAEPERRQRLDRAERDPGRDGHVRADTVRGQRERDGGARDTDVPRRQRQDSGEIERRDDQHRGGEGLLDPERGCDRGRREDAQSHREPDPAGDLRRGARAAAENAEDVERVAERRARPRVTRAPRDTAATAAASKSAAIGQRGSTPLADASASTIASQTARTALSEPAIPPTVQSRPSLWRTRDISAKRTAVPIRAGASAFTIEPVQ